MNGVIRIKLEFNSGFFKVRVGHFGIVSSFFAVYRGKRSFVVYAKSYDDERRRRSGE